MVSRVITQKDLPIIIDKSGDYSLCSDLTYKGCGAAITITANNVKLRLDFSLRLKKASATGVFVNGASEVVIENDHIINTSLDPQTGNGIFLLNATHITINNIYTLQNANGLLVQNSRDVRVTHSRFENALIAGASMEIATAIRVSLRSLSPTEGPISAELSIMDVFPGNSFLKISSCILTFPMARLVLPTFINFVPSLSPEVPFNCAVRALRACSI